MSTEKLTLGEYIRRLRKARRWTLGALADNTGLSYHNLSRIENDSTVPNAETVSQIAVALDGDMRRMLELAEAVPRVILDRMLTFDGREGPGLKRTAGSQSPSNPSDRALEAAIGKRASEAGLDAAEITEIVEAIRRLVDLEPHSRAAVIGLVKTLSVHE